MSKKEIFRFIREPKVKKSEPTARIPCKFNSNIFDFYQFFRCLSKNFVETVVTLLIFFVISASIRFHKLQTSLKRYLIELNLFKSQFNNDNHTHYQRLGTQLYISVLIIAMSILTIYSLLTEDIQCETFFNLNESCYTEL
jgi:hypothetical protein